MIFSKRYKNIKMNTKIVTGNVALTRQQLHFETDYKFSLFKVKGKQLHQKEEFVPCVGAWCSDKEFANWACHDQENTLFGRSFPERLPVLLFLNAKEGDTIIFTYNDVECHLTLNQGQSKEQFDTLLKSHITSSLERANNPDEWAKENAARCREPGSLIYINLAFKTELEELARIFA